jgi:hypothetical protein
MAPKINPTMLSDPTKRIRAATIVSMIVTPA